ncbi:predicted protein [Histoplasma capsulatum var. duboisii H88]|uniref:Predicted protein n=1 Tax=Ajellomyces capsulatus (strain H88) TaxID=544711 RepID=F0U512_AJEC8|nr:predicted protein [Histoplasma capsulatum var. duboisii H88]
MKDGELLPLPVCHVCDGCNRATPYRDGITLQRTKKQAPNISLPCILVHESRSPTLSQRRGQIQDPRSISSADGKCAAVIARPVMPVHVAATAATPAAPRLEPLEPLEPPPPASGSPWSPGCQGFGCPLWSSGAWALGPRAWDKA